MKKTKTPKLASKIGMVVRSKGESKLNLFLLKKYDFRFKNMKKTKSPKMTSKVLYELSITWYMRFNYCS